MLKSLADLIKLWRENNRAALLRLFHSREAPPAIQFLKYGICGVGALVVHTSIYLALLAVVWPELKGAEMEPWDRARSTFAPTGIAFIFSNAFVYWLNMKWVFTPGRHSPVREFFFFTVVNLPGALCGTLAQAGLVYFFHWPRWAALLGFILPNVLINFICRKFFIFQK